MNRNRTIVSCIIQQFTFHIVWNHCDELRTTMSSFQSAGSDCKTLIFTATKVESSLNDLLCLTRCSNRRQCEKSLGKTQHMKKDNNKRADEWHLLLQRSRWTWVTWKLTGSSWFSSSHNAHFHAPLAFKLQVADLCKREHSFDTTNLNCCEAKFPSFFCSFSYTTADIKRLLIALKHTRKVNCKHLMIVFTFFSVAWIAFPPNQANRWMFSFCLSKSHRRLRCLSFCCVNIGTLHWMSSLAAEFLFSFVYCTISLRRLARYDHHLHLSSFNSICKLAHICRCWAR